MAGAPSSRRAWDGISRSLAHGEGLSRSLHGFVRVVQCKATSQFHPVPLADGGAKWFMQGTAAVYASEISQGKCVWP